MQVTNKAPGPRGVNVIVGKGKDGAEVIRTVILAPGETRDLEVHMPEHRSFADAVEAGEFEVGKKAPAKAADPSKQDDGKRQTREG